MTNFYCQTLDESVGQPNSIRSLNINNPADDCAVSSADGYEAAFQNIWDRFNLPIRKFIFEMCGNYELTEELAQETFVRIFKGVSKYRGDTKFSPWVFGIAKYVVLENLRELKKIIVMSKSITPILPTTVNILFCLFIYEGKSKQKKVVIADVLLPSRR